MQATLADSFLADLDELSDNEADLIVSILLLVSVKSLGQYLFSFDIRYMIMFLSSFRRKMKLVLEIWKKMLMGKWQT